MSRFRKRPVVIDAFRPGEDEPDWWLEAVSSGRATVFNGYTQINTSEGIMAVGNKDWIIRGVKGEIYPCKPDIFEAMYEPV